MLQNWVLIGRKTVQENRHDASINRSSYQNARPTKPTRSMYILSKGKGKTARPVPAALPLYRCSEDGPIYKCTPPSTQRQQPYNTKTEDLQHEGSRPTIFTLMLGSFQTSPRQRDIGPQTWSRSRSGPSSLAGGAGRSCSQGVTQQLFYRRFPEG